MGTQLAPKPNPQPIIVVHPGEAGRKDISQQFSTGRIQHFLLLPAFAAYHRDCYIYGKPIPQLVFVSHYPPRVHANRVLGIVRRRNPAAIVFAVGAEASNRLNWNWRDNPAFDEVLTFPEFSILLRQLSWSFLDHHSRHDLVQIVTDHRGRQIQDQK